MPWAMGGRALKNRPEMNNSRPSVTSDGFCPAVVCSTTNTSSE
jgi:hypothetical protein